MIPVRSRFSPATACLVVAVLLVACGGSGGKSALDARASNDSASPDSGDARVSRDEQGPAPAEAISGPDELFGTPLDHPERYYGLYADRETPNRQWFVTEARRPLEAEQAPEVPPGHLAIGATFGDVAPWTMRTVSTTEFEQAFVSDHDPEPVAVVFELAEDGSALSMTFTSESYASMGRLERQGDLPPEWR